MPWVSDKQRAWGHTPAGTKALGGPAKVAEWDHAKLANGGPAMPMMPSARPMGGAMTAPRGQGAPSTPPGPGTPVAGGADTAVGGISSSAPANKGYSGAPVAMAAGGPVLGRGRSFGKTVSTKALPNPPDEFTGGRMPTKQSAPAKQGYSK